MRHDRETEHPAEESALVAALRQGDEAAFTELIRRHQSTMLRTASSYVSSRAVAEEVVNESWLAVVEGIDRFEGRASLRTWIFRILINRAKTRGQREARTLPFSALLACEEGMGEPSTVPQRLRGHHDSERLRLWSGPADSPQDRLLSGEAMEVVRRAMGDLPERQARVIGLRDMAGWSAREVCDSLGLADSNQRVLLHRARSKVRVALEGYLHAEAPA